MLYNAFKTILTILILYVASHAFRVIFPPFSFPKNIPTIPFYVSFLSQFTRMDQKDIYEKYLQQKLEKFGAVKIYFGSRWNILVTRPEFLQQILRRDDVFAKSGNQKKIPHSVLAEYTGDNVISADGESWKTYRQILTKPIMFPDLQPLEKNCSKLFGIIRENMENGMATLPVSDILQRFCIANIGDCVIGIDFKTLQLDDANGFHNQLRYLKTQIFKPLFMAFPLLDKLPFPSRIKARKTIQKFKNSYCTLIKQNSSTDSSERAAPLLCKALERGIFTRRQFEDNSMILLIAGHENPQLLLTSLLFVLAEHPTHQQRIRDETIYGSEPAYLLSFIYETIRLYPPLGQIINKCTTSSTVIGRNIKIPKGVYIGYNNFATQRSRSVWGEDANEFKPERWGRNMEEVQKNYMSSKVKCKLSAFHGRKRACIGEKFALNVAKTFVLQVVSNFYVAIDPSWKTRLTPSGPVSPLSLRVQFAEIKQSNNSRN